MRHIVFYEMNKKEMNMILMEEYDEEEIHLVELDLMLIYEIFLNNFFDEVKNQIKQNNNIFIEKIWNII
jgi:hypothetical protein